MKAQASRQESPPVFVPVRLEITFESQEEVEKFYAIFNHAPIVEPIGFESASNYIRDTLSDTCPGVYHASDPWRRKFPI